MAAQIRAAAWAPVRSEGRASGAEILQRGPLSHQLLMAHQAVTGPLVGLNAVLLTQRGELLPQGVEDGMVVVQGTEANVQTLTETEDPIGSWLQVLQQWRCGLLRGDAADRPPSPVQPWI